MSDPVLEPVEGGVCAVPRITAAGVTAGLKPSGRPDVALVAAPAVATAAAVQTRNRVTAAPVEVTRRHVADGRARAVLLNAGSANVCVGPDGDALAEESARVAAAALGCAPDEVLLCSTGVIGVPIRREPFLAGIPQAVEALAPDGGRRAAQAIMTTDLVEKEAAVRVRDAGGSCTVGGMAKGSGMIAPAMATMLCVVTTDAALPAAELSAMLHRSVDRTFGRISVDGCMSTNDAVIALATGSARPSPAPAAVEAGLTAVCAALAEAIVRDGEGARKLLRITVSGAAAEDDAVAVGRAIAGSDLVRTAVAGGDPNWGRILAAMGAGPVDFDPRAVAVSFGGVVVCRDGMAAGYDPARAVAALAGDEVDLDVDLGGGGPASATFLTCDLTHGYITINADYTT